MSRRKVKPTQLTREPLRGSRQMVDAILEASETAADLVASLQA